MSYMWNTVSKVKYMDIEQIRLNYQKKLAALEERQAATSKRVAELCTELGLVPSEVTATTVSQLLQEATDKKAALEAELSDKIKAYESAVEG